MLWWVQHEWIGTRLSVLPQRQVQNRQLLVLVNDCGWGNCKISTLEYLYFFQNDFIMDAFTKRWNFKTKYINLKQCFVSCDLDLVKSIGVTITDFTTKEYNDQQITSGEESLSGFGRFRTPEKNKKKKILVYILDVISITYENKKIFMSR